MSTRKDLAINPDAGKKHQKDIPAHLKLSPTDGTEADDERGQFSDESGHNSLAASRVVSPHQSPQHSPITLTSHVADYGLVQTSGRSQTHSPEHVSSASDEEIEVLDLSADLPQSGVPTSKQQPPMYNTTNTAGDTAAIDPKTGAVLPDTNTAGDTAAIPRATRPRPRPDTSTAGEIAAIDRDTGRVLSEDQATSAPNVIRVPLHELTPEQAEAFRRMDVERFIKKMQAEALIEPSADDAASSSANPSLSPSATPNLSAFSEVPPATSLSAADQHDINAHFAALGVSMVPMSPSPSTLPPAAQPMFPGALPVAVQPALPSNFPKAVQAANRFDQAVYRFEMEAWIRNYNTPENLAQMIALSQNTPNPLPPDTQFTREFLEQAFHQLVYLPRMQYITQQVNLYRMQQQHYAQLQRQRELAQLQQQLQPASNVAAPLLPSQPLPSTLVPSTSSAFSPALATPSTSSASSLAAPAPSTPSALVSLRSLPATPEASPTPAASLRRSPMGERERKALEKQLKPPSRHRSPGR